MFEAQYLFHNDAVFTDWMPRAGEYIRVTADLIARQGANLEVAPYVKNRDEPGDGNVLLTPRLTVTAVGRKDIEWDDLKELVRYRISCTGNSADDHVLFRLLSPIWYDDVKA